MPHRSFLQLGAFEPKVVAAMGQAYDVALIELHDTGQPQIVLDVIAERIIAAASGGECDPVRLWKAALPWLLEY
jgi:hypothetical protein